jgi:type II secretory pathway component PulJ
LASACRTSQVHKVKKQDKQALWEALEAMARDLMAL